jgi:hypothetical protein
MTRVLVGDFSALHRLGFEEILRGDGIELVQTNEVDVVDRLVQALPDVIVLDLDQIGVPRPGAPDRAPVPDGQGGRLLVGTAHDADLPAAALRRVVHHRTRSGLLTSAIQT